MNMAHLVNDSPTFGTIVGLECFIKYDDPFGLLELGKVVRFLILFGYRN